MRSFTYIVLALPILFASTVADAQQRKAANPLSDDIIEARRGCFAEAQARHPGNDQASATLNSQRANAYKDCALRKGVRP